MANEWWVQIQHVIDVGILETMVSIQDGPDVQKEVLWAVANVTSCASAEQV